MLMKLDRRPRPRRRSASTWRVLAAGVAALLVSSCGSYTRNVPPHVKLEFEKYTLRNGLEIILRRDARLPIAAVNLWYHVGPANESAGRTGFAHLFEHMMFQASGHVPDDQYFPILEGAGASFINGTTDFDRTNYMEDVPSNELEKALWLESDRMGFLLDRLDQTMLSNQQDVVRNERRQSLENAPYGLVEEAMYHQLFPKGHPYHAQVIGSHADIQAARLEDVRDFFTRYYCPNNASLAIVGDIDIPRTRALVEKYFAGIPAGEPVPAASAPAPSLAADGRAVVTDRVELPRVYMAWLTAPIFKPGDAEAVVTARILGEGKTSRLYKSLVYERKIAQTVAAQQQSLALGSIFQVTVTAKPSHAAEELEKGIDAELAKLAAAGPTGEELAAAKNGISSEIITSLEHLGGFDGVANRFNLYNQYLRDPGYLEQDLARFAAVSVEDVRRFAAEQLKAAHRVVVYGVPGEKRIAPEPPTPPAPRRPAARVESKEPWRIHVPDAAPASPAALPSAKRFQLANGLPVFLVESHALPIVAAELVVRSGSGADPADRPGLAGFALSMLDEGAGKRDALGLARDLEAIGARLETGAITDGSMVTMRALKPQAVAAMKIMSDVVLAPTFPESEVDRVRNDRLTSIQQERDSPFRTAIRVLTGCLFGPGHPYGHVALGDEDALRSIGREELVGFYRRAFSPENAALVLAGDLTEREARQIAQLALGAWKGAAATPPRPGPGTPMRQRIGLVDTPGAPQTALLVGQMGVMRSDPDYERLNVMNQVLGGLFSSRINMNLREQHGYSYGAFSYLPENRGVGPLVVGSMVRTDATGASLREILEESRGMREHEVTPNELRLARESIARSLPAMFETTESTVGTIGSLWLYDLPPDYYEGLPARLEAMTAADVFAATRRHLAPDSMIVIAVGDRSAIAPQLAKLGLGAISLRDFDGREAKPGR
jgi:zinc protease